MGLLSSLLDTRAVDASDFDLGDPLFTSITDSGERVTEDNAMRLVSVYAAVTLIADAIRALPVDIFRRRDDQREQVTRVPQWLSMPNTRQTWGQFIDFVLHSLLTNGNAFIWLPQFNDMGFAETMEAIHPEDVQVQTSPSKQLIVRGKKMSELGPGNPLGSVLHILAHTSDGIVGLSPIDQARQAIGSGKALEKFGNKFFSNGATTSGTIELPAGSVPTDDQLRQVKKQFTRRHSGTDNAWKPIVLGNGATFKPITVPNDQAQFLESQKFNVAQIARLYRIPPHLIGDVERSTSWGTGIEEQNRMFVALTLMPWIIRLEESFSQLLPRGQFVKFNVDAMLRADSSNRAQFYQTMAQIQAMTINEIRAKEDMPPLDGGDTPPPPPNAAA